MYPNYCKEVLFILFANMLFPACAVNKCDVLIKTQIGSSYSYKTIKTSTQNLPVICATVYESETNFPLVVSHINLDGNKDLSFETDSTKIVFNVQPGTHILEAWWMGYLNCETKKFNTSTGDTLNFKFYLKIDTRPLTQPLVFPYKKKKNN